MAETFETLKARLANWLDADLVRFPDDVRGDCINFVQRELLRKHDLRFGEAFDTLSLSASIREYALPATWRSPFTFWYESPTSGALIYLDSRTKDEFDALYPDSGDTGDPSDYTIWGTTLYLGPTPGNGITLNRNYYQYLPDLADGAPNNTNSLIDQAWDVVFFGGLEHATKYLIEDARAPMWAARFRELEMTLVSEHRRAKSVGRVAQSQEPG